MVKYLSKSDDFYDIVSTSNCLIDFYAEWCGPCQMLSSVLEEIDFIDIIKINTDVFPELAQKFGVMSIPTLCFYKDGVCIQKIVGYRTKEELKEIYNKLFN